MTDAPIVRNSADLADAFAARKAELGLSNTFCDAIGGLAAGHTDKMLGPSRNKRIGPLTFDVFCELFAVQFRMEQNNDALSRMESRFEARNEAQVRVHAQPLSITVLTEAKRAIFAAAGRKSAATRNRRLSPLRRSMIARKAAQVRWEKRKKT